MLQKKKSDLISSLCLQNPLTIVPRLVFKCEGMHTQIYGNLGGSYNFFHNGKYNFHKKGQKSAAFKGKHVRYKIFCNFCGVGRRLLKGNSIHVNVWQNQYSIVK